MFGRSWPLPATPGPPLVMLCYEFNISILHLVKLVHFNIQSTCDIFCLFLIDEKLYTSIKNYINDQN